MRTIVLLVIVLFAPVNAFCQFNSSDLQAKLDARVSQYSLTANDLADAILKTAKQFEIPVGVEWLKDKKTSHGLTLAWKEATVRNILESLVHQYPGYSLRVEHGVVHVFREDLMNDKRNFLNLKVPKDFDVRNEIGGLTNQRLRGAVQNIVSPRRLPPGAGVGGSYATGIDEKPLALELADGSVREALDKLARASEHNMWIVTFSDASSITPTGFLRTETRWHPSPFTDSDQPMWELLAWAELVSQPNPASSPTTR